MCFEFRHDQELSPLHVVQIGYRVHPTSCPIGTDALSPGVKRPGREADHSPQSCVEVKNGGTVQQETIVARERLFKHVFTATNSRDRNKRHGRNNKGIVCDVFYVVRADIIQEGPQAEA